MTDNAAQIEAWNGPVGARWVRLQTMLDTVFEAHCLAAVDAARLATGDSVLDVGCGCGATSLEAARRVGPRGLVVGVDVSLPMATRARARAAAEGLTRVRFDVGDVQTAALGVARFEVMLSRFGVMFFDDPVRAFTNGRRALRGGGRLAFVGWQSALENPWITVPERAAAGLVPIPEAPPDGPGPFSFADPARVVRILRGAGFTRVAVDPLALPLTFPGSLTESAALLVQFGLLGRALTEAPDGTRARVLAAVEGSLAPYAGRRGIVMPCSAWLVTAAAGP